MKTTAAGPATHWRDAALGRIPMQCFDLAVIGAGINGAAIAHFATLAGLSVLIIEKGDLASGTSSRSSRLIHGGLRYLEHGSIGMVLESSRERARLATLAPHLARPLRFTWPVYAGARVPLWKLRGGLTLYDLLGAGSGHTRHTTLTPGGIAEQEPELSRTALVGGAAYYDNATDDSRLVIANVRSAVSQGAALLTHAEVVGITQAGSDTQLWLHDVLNAAQLTATARVVVNATGPWADHTEALAGGTVAPAVLGSKGVHITLPRRRVGNRGAVTLLSPLDGRVFFVLPSGESTLVGTTDTVLQGSPDDVRADQADIDYLLASVNHYFDRSTLTHTDVISAWAGVRPLAAAYEGDDTATASREHALRWSGAMLTVTGGKLTTYRVVARDAVAAVLSKRGLGRSGSAVRGHRLSRLLSGREHLPGGGRYALRDESSAAARATQDDTQGSWLAETYGSEWRAVWQIAREKSELRERLAATQPVLAAAVVFAVRNEFALTVADVLVRRTHLACDTPDQGRSLITRIAGIMAAELGWSASEQRTSEENCNAELARIFGTRVYSGATSS